MSTPSLQARREAIGKTDRVVVKVGTRLLTDPERIPELVAQIAAVRARGVKVILVSSGAVGLGMKALELDKRPPQLSKKQALASVGQCKLMYLYEEAARQHGFHVGQLLLTALGLRERERHINALNCINALLDMDILPVINENDSISVDELKFGDNDTLAGLVAAMTRCKLTVILTTVDGLHDVKDGKLSGRIPLVCKITPAIRKLAGSTDDNQLSIGGMASKLKAADIAMASGDYLWIADGREPGVLGKVFEAADVGTLFVPGDAKEMPSKKRWLSFFTKPKGKLTLDAGAVRAVEERGKSLLPAGVVGVEGNFQRGDTVELVDASGRSVARGLVNYTAKEARAAMGLNSSELPARLGEGADPELVHRDNLALNRFL